MPSIFDLRNAFLTRARFRARVQKIPLLQGVARQQSVELFRLCSGFVHSQLLLACVRLGLFELLRGGALPVAEIADRLGLPVERAERLLGAAAALRLTESRPGDRFGLGMLGAALVENPSVQAMVEHHALLYADLADPVSLFAGSGPPTGLSALWPYSGSAGPERLAETDVSAYSTLMAESQVMVAEQILGAVSFRRFRRLLDLGGGSGAFAIAAADRWPGLSVTVADLPAVACMAKKRIAEAGLDHRISVVGADAVADDLPRGFDAVSLVRIIHDHDEERALDLLAAARVALRDGGVLILAEPMADKADAGRFIDAYFSVYLLAMGTGRPRSFAGLSALLEQAGFRKIRRRRTHVPLITSVITAVPVSKRK